MTRPTMQKAFMAVSNIMQPTDEEHEVLAAVAQQYTLAEKATLYAWFLILEPDRDGVGRFMAYMMPGQTRVSEDVEVFMWLMNDPAYKDNLPLDYMRYEKKRLEHMRYEEKRREADVSRKTG